MRDKTASGKEERHQGFIRELPHRCRPPADITSSKTWPGAPVLVLSGFSPRLLPARSPGVHSPRMLQNSSLLPSGVRRRKRVSWEESSVSLFLVSELPGTCLSPQQGRSRVSLERVWPRPDPQPPAGDIPAGRGTRPTSADRSSAPPLGMGSVDLLCLGLGRGDVSQTRALPLGGEGTGGEAAYPALLHELCHAGNGGVWAAGFRQTAVLTLWISLTSWVTLAPCGM